MKLILASTSPYRATQLNQIGAHFEAAAPDFDEEAAKDLSLSPKALAEQLALGKAESLRDQFPRDAILGGDQLIAFNGQILGKPGTASAAVEQLLSLSGKTHQLMTSVYLITPNQTYQHTDIAEMQMRNLTRAQIEAYVSADSPLDCAGSYKLECAGISLFERINSEDFSAIQGLPLITLARWFAELKIESSALGYF